MTLIKSIFSRLSIIACFALLLSQASLANTDVTDAEQYVLKVTTSIVDLLKTNKAQYTADENALNAMVRREVLPFIDFTAMSKLTLGKHWKSASDDQKTRFINAFREMLVRSYAKTMIRYEGAKISGGNSTANKKPGYVTVKTAVTPSGGSAIVANYSLRKVDDSWKAYNVEIAGINLITNFRTNFTREVSAKGLDALITRLESTEK